MPAKSPRPGGKAAVHENPAYVGPGRATVPAADGTITVWTDGIATTPRTCIIPLFFWFLKGSI